MKLTTVKCGLCDNWMASMVTKRGAPFLYCGVCKYGFMLLAKEGKDNFSSKAQEIDETDLPEPTKKWFKDKNATINQG